MRKKSRKLRLRRETIRTIDQLRVRGGVGMIVTLDTEPRDDCMEILDELSHVVGTCPPSVPAVCAQ